MEKKIRIVGAERIGRGYKVFLDKEDISDMVNDVVIHVKVGEINTAVITFTGISIDAEGLVDVTSIEDNARRYAKE